MTVCECFSKLYRNVRPIPTNNISAWTENAVNI